MQQSLTLDVIFVLQTVLVIADSHVRALVDGYAKKPPGEDLSFGYLSIPGGTAKDIGQEVAALVVPEPDAVCIVGCSNNLDLDVPVEKSAADFQRLLLLALDRWPGRVCLSLIFLTPAKSPFVTKTFRSRSRKIHDCTR